MQPLAESAACQPPSLGGVTVPDPSGNQGGDARLDAIRRRVGEGRLMLDVSAAEHVRRRLLRGAG
ncbi:hypothetical protein SAMN05421507_12210 [Lentzea jiangxiensis]|uniref:Uncharacterized protein n=1 Tax=Lentzea jiangxiensis TaxID=641025 RepID=A0A1H0WS07_9PSEU|nr:hypothetical protein SAMN05421507_12210 [Lentzea jiangxiensis]